MKKVLKLVSCGILFVFMFNYTVSAAISEDSLPPELLALKEAYAAQLSDISFSECKNTLVPIFDIETLEFFNFLDKHFKNKSSTSSLANTAIARYSDYKKKIDGHMDQVALQFSASYDVSLYEAESEALLQCEEIKDSYLRLVKDQMIRHIRSNSVAKKTTMLLEKFEEINEQLRELNMAIARMYSFYMTFKNKLPGFLKECL